MGKSGFKQHNKPFKSSSNSKAGSSHQRFKCAPTTDHTRAAVSLITTKNERKNQTKQRLHLQRQQQLEQTRSFGNDRATRLIQIVSISPEANSLEALKSILSRCKIVYQSTQTITFGTVTIA